MFTIVVTFGPSGTIWLFNYTSAAAARKVYREAFDAMNGGGMVALFDDFGQEAWLPAAEIRGMLIQDMEQAGQAAIERSLLDARHQVAANKRANSDPELRAHAIQQRLSNGLMQPGPLPRS